MRVIVITAKRPNSIQTFKLNIFLLFLSIIFSFLYIYSHFLPPNEAKIYKPVTKHYLRYRTYDSYGTRKLLVICYIPSSLGRKRLFSECVKLCGTYVKGRMYKCIFSLITNIYLEILYFSSPFLIYLSLVSLVSHSIVKFYLF